MATRCAADETRVEALEKERDEWIAHTKRAVWADSEECKVLEARCEALEQALREIRDFTDHVPEDDPLSHVCGVAKVALGENNE